MEVKYYKDLRHNFLIIRNMDEPVNGYQFRMITNNKIGGLLPCKERHINGELFLYYEITSKQSLLSLYENRRINMEFLSRLFVQLKTTWDNMSRFLLEEQYLVLNPKYIYTDIESGELLFLYYPFISEENYIKQLFVFLTEKVDSEDDAAVDICYKALDLIERDQFVLDEVLNWFEQECCFCHKKENELKPIENAENEDGEKKMFEKERDYATDRFFFRAINEKFWGRVIILLGTILAVCIYIYQNYELAEANLICLYAVFLADIFFMAFIVGHFIYQKIRSTIRKKKNLYVEDEKWYEKKVIGLDDMSEENKANNLYGNTVFIPWTENSENKLYGIGKKNKNHIDLSRLPVTVGKLDGMVDMVIDDTSISRRHAKFHKENGQIYMTDLNSTNGTFKNGLRLEPNTSEVLEQGDEIRLGKLKFIYR